MERPSLIILKARIFFLLTFAFMIVILFRVLFIQIYHGPRLRKIANSLVLEYRPILATRGNVYSEDNGILATSLPFYILAIDPMIADEKVYYDNIEDLSKKLASVFKDKSYKVYKKRLIEARKSKKRYIRLNRKRIDYIQKKQCETWPIFNLGRRRGGVIYEKIDRRFKPFGSLASRTIGHINENNKGSGLEFSFNSYLKGKDGEGLYQKTLGGWKILEVPDQLKPQNGKDIISTINTKIQDITESSLREALIESDADYGCSIIMEVKTGHIKGVVNLTRIDEGVYSEVYNYAIGRRRDPGSTMKILSMMALMEHADIDLERIIDTGNGVKSYYDKIMKDHNYRRGGFGEIPVRTIIERSSNIGVITLMEEIFGHNPNKLIEFYDKIGLSQPLDFQIKGEPKPIIKNPKDKNWSEITLPWMSVGYEIEFSPLHLLTFYNAIANDGKLIEPIIVKEIRCDGKVERRFKSRVINNKICSDKTLRTLKSLLEGVVQNGSGKRISKGIYSIAGKSGTAQILRDGGYSRSWYVSFIGYFPVEDPKYICIVGIDNPKGFKQYGGDMAAPVVRKIADKMAVFDFNTLLRKNKVELRDQDIKSSIPRVGAGDYTDIMTTAGYLGFSINKHHKKTNSMIRVKKEDNSLNTYDNLIYPIGRMPSIFNFTLKDAIHILETHGLRFRLEGEGNRVSNQDPLPGAKVCEDQIVIVYT